MSKGGHLNTINIHVFILTCLGHQESATVPSLQPEVFRASDFSFLSFLNYKKLTQITAAADVNYPMYLYQQGEQAVAGGCRLVVYFGLRLVLLVGTNCLA